MAVDISERAFEAAIEQDLCHLGYRKRKPGDYDRKLCLDPELLLDFIQATQPEKWTNLEDIVEADARGRFLGRVGSEIEGRGTSEMLHDGIKVAGIQFDLAYFKPAGELNEEHLVLYRANIFSIVRQLKYGTRESEKDKELDWVVFLNGIPLFAAELKDNFTKQSARDAVAQWRTRRDHREPLFKLGRLLGFFAVDDDVVQVATHLNGESTRFLPFNRGKDGGAGNPPTTGYATEYLWKEVLAPDRLVDLIQHFIFKVEVEDDSGKKTGEHQVLFPRYHQLSAVSDAVAHARKNGAGHNYLFHHSAGSGKSNTIAWLANQLSLLHDDKDEPVFDSVIVLTDRRVLDRQLQTTLRRLQRTTGVLENIDKTSAQLREALESGKRIIVSTIQKFPVIQNQMEALPGKRFALLIDEAHGSQGGEASAAIKKVLDTESLEEAEKLDSEGEKRDLEDEIVDSMRKRGRLENLSSFAFTATPKKQTLELFGTKKEGGFVPFSLYSRRQAIEEGFIVDVLRNYVTYDSYWKLMKKVEGDPKYDRTKAQALLKAFVAVHPNMVEEKVGIAVEVFEAQSHSKIAGHAKAMYVCGSRLHAVRTKLAMDAYLAERKLNWKTLVAFSDTVRDGGRDYTEFNMNGIPETQTAATFKGEEYRFLIVANKFQTGFDQPLLHMMVVDKKLNAANAVQTLERLNRIHPLKEETLILDFVNEPKTIEEAFAVYHLGTVLTEPTDPDLVHDLETEIKGSDLHEQDEVDEFAKVWFSDKTTQADLHPILAPTVERYEEAGEGNRAEFRGSLGNYVRLYGFLSGIITFADPELEKLYLWARLLLTKLPTPEGNLPLDVQTNIELSSMKVRRRGKQKIDLPGEAGELAPIDAPPTAGATEEDLAPLSSIIKELNEHFGVELSEDDRVTIHHLETKLDENAGLEKTMEVNDPEDAKLSFDHIAEREFGEIMESNSKLYKLVMNDEELRGRLFGRLFDRFVERHGKAA